MPVVIIKCLQTQPTKGMDKKGFTEEDSSNSRFYFFSLAFFSTRKLTRSNFPIIVLSVVQIGHKQTTIV